MRKAVAFGMLAFREISLKPQPGLDATTRNIVIVLATNSVVREVVSTTTTADKHRK